MRFSSDDHLKAWTLDRKYPPIHRQIVRAVLDHSVTFRYCDLCCWTGLLGQQVLDRSGTGTVVVGVESNQHAIDCSEAAGVKVKIFPMWLKRDNLSDFAELLVENKIEALIARRCMPELFGSDLEAGKLFAEYMAGIGIKEIFLQGRVVQPAATNPLFSVVKEIELFAEFYRSVMLEGQIAVLRLK